MIEEKEYMIRFVPDSGSWDFTEALWNTPVPSAFNERYYYGLLYLMGTLHCSGEFRIWKPSR